MYSAHVLSIQAGHMEKKCVSFVSADFRARVLFEKLSPRNMSSTFIDCSLSIDSLRIYEELWPQSEKRNRIRPIFRSFLF